MSTKPTRIQQQAADQLADALVLITDAHRLDSKGALSAAEFEELARRIAGVSSGFSLDEIAVRALERRASALKLTSSAVDLISLQDDGPDLPRILLLTDEELVELVKRLEEELGVL